LVLAVAVTSPHLRHLNPAELSLSSATKGAELDQRSNRPAPEEREDDLANDQLHEMATGLFVANDSIHEYFALRTALFDDPSTAAIVRRVEHGG
jgi:hypothetical protein